MVIDDSFVDAVGEAVGHHSGAWDMVDPKEIVRAVLLVAERRLLLGDAYRVICSADSELSAIAHGRPPSDKETLLSLSGQLRRLYEHSPNYSAEMVTGAPARRAFGN